MLLWKRSGSLWGFDNMKKITCEEYDTLKASGEPFIMLDVRNQDEYDDGHMEDAVLIPLHILPLKAPEALPDKNMKIITCCQHGGRASQAAAYLVGEGYTDVVILDGGYKGYCGR